MGDIGCSAHCVGNCFVAHRDGTTQCATTVTAAACSRLHHRPEPPSSLSHQPQPHMQPMERDLALAVKQPSHGRCSCSCQPGLLLRAQCKQLARIGVVESSRCPQVRPWRQKAAASSLWHRGGCVWLRCMRIVSYCHSPRLNARRQGHPQLDGCVARWHDPMRYHRAVSVCRPPSPPPRAALQPQPPATASHAADGV